MIDEAGDIVRVLARVRRRWRSLGALRAWTRAALTAAAILAVALMTSRITAPSGIAITVLWAITLTLAVAALAWGMVGLRRTPSDVQVARFVEERCPELEDTLAAAVADRRASSSDRVLAAVVADAARRIHGLDLDRIVDRRLIRRATLQAVGGTLALAIAGVLAAGPIGRGAALVALRLFPDRYSVEVSPGDVRIRAGQPLRIVAKVPSAIGAVAPVLRFTDGGRWRDARMDTDRSGFASAFDHVEHDFTYRVEVAGRSTRDYAVTVVRPPHVQRIDLRYTYPAAFDMEPRAEEDGGDIYGPVGTRVHLTVYADKPVASGALTLEGGLPVVLRPQGDRLEADLTIREDGSYRVALSDGEGSSNAGDTEYFIRTLDDRPPDVRIVRPADDRDVTPLEEVTIDARADDDFGVAALDLVFSVRGRDEKVVPFDRSGSGTTVNGRRILYLEDLGVEPGDFVTYHARARDVSRGKRATETRSDIYFLQVAPFDEEFVASQSNAGSGSGNQELDSLVDAQKQIVTATWTLDRRARDSGRRSEDDIRVVGRAQSGLRKRVLGEAAQMQRAADLRRRRPGIRPPVGLPPQEPSDEAMGKAADAMLGAQQRLEALATSAALPFEMTALNELMRAQADVRRREVQRQQNGGGGRVANRQQQDLSSLFDRELARQQQTNYEAQKASSETRSQDGQDDAANRVRELARRQEAINRQQQQLAASPSDAERRRALERLTREQSELRQEAERLAEELQQRAASRQSGAGSQQARGGGQQTEATSRALQQASEEMRGATSDLRRQDAEQARARGARALERLRDVETRLQQAQPDAGRRAASELQLESQQIADAQRRLSNELSRDPRDNGAAATRRADQQGELADRMQRLERTVRQLADQHGENDRAAGAALSDAAGELDRQRLSERMRQSANAQRDAAGGARNAPGERPDDTTRLARDGEAMARALDGVAGRLGAAGGESDQARRLGEELSRVRELRDRLAALDRQLADAERNGGRSGGRGADEPAPSKEAARGDRQANSPWDGAQELLDDLRRESGLGLTPRALNGLNPGVSAPGTEAWKRDFARWEELNVQVTAALEKAEASAAARLRRESAKDRLSAGRAQATPESYRELVEKYYRALAAKTPTQ